MLILTPWSFTTSVLSLLEDWDLGQENNDVKTDRQLFSHKIGIKFSLSLSVTKYNNVSHSPSTFY